MRKLLRVLLLLVVLPAALWSGAVGAQSASCAGVAAWNATTIYNAGDKMVYNNHLYQASTQIWNTPPNYCPSCGWYQDLGQCGSGSNQPPTVGLTSPANGATFTAGANITLSANASDSDGTVAKVEF